KQTSGLVVSVVLKSRCSSIQKSSIGFRFLVSTQGDKSSRRCIGLMDVERPDRIQSVERSVQPVAAIFSRKQRVLVSHRQIVTSRVHAVASEEDRNQTSINSRSAHRHFEYRTPRSACGQRGLIA